jgi:hypothetical protein
MLHDADTDQALSDPSLFTEKQWQYLSMHNSLLHGFTIRTKKAPDGSVIPDKVGKAPMAGSCNLIPSSTSRC